MKRHQLILNILIACCLLMCARMSVDHCCLRICPALCLVRLSLLIIQQLINIDQYIDHSTRPTFLSFVGQRLTCTYLNKLWYATSDYCCGTITFKLNLPSNILVTTTISVSFIFCPSINFYCLLYLSMLYHYFIIFVTLTYKIKHFTPPISPFRH